MFKNILYIVLPTLLFVSACSKDSEDISTLTYKAKFEIVGDNPAIVSLGETYTDQGAKVYENGKEISCSADISAVNTDNMGVYNVVYSAKNSDGYASSATRTVVVKNPASPLMPLYNVTIVRTTSAGTTKRGPFQIKIGYNAADGSYSCSDCLGGWYDQGSGYGSDYAMISSLVLGPDSGDGTTPVTMSSSSVPGWGDSASDFSGSVNNTTSAFTFTTTYAGYLFACTCTPVM